MMVASALVNQVRALKLKGLSVLMEGEKSCRLAIGAGPTIVVNSSFGNRYDLASSSLLVARSMSLCASPSSGAAFRAMRTQSSRLKAALGAGVSAANPVTATAHNDHTARQEHKKDFIATFLCV